LLREDYSALDSWPMELGNEGRVGAGKQVDTCYENNVVLEGGEGIVRNLEIWHCYTRA
jgi:hypothetical protein